MYMYDSRRRVDPSILNSTVFENTTYGVFAIINMHREDTGEFLFGFSINVHIGVAISNSRPITEETPP
jgi:hypothetical protein